ASLRDLYPFLDAPTARRLVRAYGTEAAEVLGEAREAADLGRDFGAGLSEREAAWLMEREWARTADDVLWRRSKLGLRLTPAEAETLEGWMAARRQAMPSAIQGGNEAAE
ncbi:MAG TPA: glycerol-3-phosphate dehydrogenase C-terminal domain-containing protein, partial [Thermohalobaculum sp.]|nr:glycerol-3-phosphate dehydrogenase C-terminal domain-containing protein [Thermohalobaculum sp.]